MLTNPEIKIYSIISENFKKNDTSKNLERITDHTTVWSPHSDVSLPIDSADIPCFREWVNWSGWKGYEEDHLAHDFAAFINSSGNCILGLPEQTPVRAIADGVVRQVSRGLCEHDGYATFINIEHGKEKSGMFSAYHHVNPLVKDDQPVKKGDVIATLHKDPGSVKGRLVHLHLELKNGWNFSPSYRKRHVDPATVFPEIAKYRATPQGKIDFRIEGLKNQPKIEIANFKNLGVND